MCIWYTWDRSTLKSVIIILQWAFCNHLITYKKIMHIFGWSCRIIHTESCQNWSNERPIVVNSFFVQFWFPNVCYGKRNPVIYSLSDLFTTHKYYGYIILLEMVLYVTHAYFITLIIFYIIKPCVNDIAWIVVFFSQIDTC